MNNTKTIEKIIKSKEAPKNTNVIWLDLNETENIDNPSLKVFNDGEWVHITADMEELLNTLDIVLQDKADLVGGKVPASQLPSYVDDVQEFYEILQGSDSQIVGEIYFNNGRYPDLYNKSFIRMNKNGVMEEVYKPERGKLYLSTNTNKLYRWTGSVLLDITQKGLQLGTTSTEAFPANLGYQHNIGRFNNYHINISDGKYSDVNIGTSGTMAVNIYDNVTIGTGVNITKNSKIGTNYNAVNVYGNIGTGSVIEDGVTISTNVHINGAAMIGNKEFISTAIVIGTNASSLESVYIGSNVCIGTNVIIGSKYSTDSVLISGNTKIGSNVNVADGTQLKGTVQINNAPLGTGQFIVGTSTTGYYNPIVKIGTNSQNCEIHLDGNVFLGGLFYVDKNSRCTLSPNAKLEIFNYASLTLEKNAGIYLSSNNLIYLMNTSALTIGTYDERSSVFIDGYVNIGHVLPTLASAELVSNRTYIEPQVHIGSGFDSRNIILGTDSKSKIKINNVAGELSFGTNGNNYAVTFGSNSITFTNKLTNLSTSLTLS